MDVSVIFQDKIVSFPINQEDKAENLLNKQKQYWMDFLSNLSLSRLSNRPAYPKINQVVNVLRGTIDVSQSLFKLDRNEETVALIGKLPILRNQVSQDEIVQNLGQFYIAVAIEVVPPLLDEIVSSGVDIAPFMIFNHPSLIQETFNYLSAKNKTFQKKEEYLDSLMFEAKREIENNKLSASQILEGIEEQKSLIFSDMLSEKTKMENYRSDMSSRFEEFIEGGNKQITAAREAAFEGAVLSSALSVWNDKLNSHRTGFWTGLVFMAAAVLFVSASSIYFHKDLMDWLPKKNDGDIPYGVIILFLVPIVAFGWLLKIVGRFTANAGALGDDARQRGALISTYLNLVGDPNSRVEQGERLLILSAIFRPLLNQGQDDLSGPTVAELLKDAITPKK